MRRRRYRTVDVFTDRLFGGNPLAVVLDAQGLSTAQMQSVAAEFGYSETTFVLPPRDPAHTAQVRIFTPRAELPFAGHPNVGTAFVLAGATKDSDAGLVFEEAAGLVKLTPIADQGVVIGAEFVSPQPFRRGETVAVELAAGCLSVAVADVRTAVHPPQISSVGVAFVMVELASLGALGRAAPDLERHRALVAAGAPANVYAYVRGGDGDLDARMFAPLDGIFEDPATGSAAAAIVGLLADAHGLGTLSLVARQGAQMGRPSRLEAAAWRVDGAIMTRVGGRCVAVMDGVFVL